MGRRAALASSTVRKTSVILTSCFGISNLWIPAMWYTLLAAGDSHHTGPSTSPSSSAGDTLLVSLIQSRVHPNQLKQIHTLIITRNPELTPLFLKSVSGPSTIKYARQLFDTFPHPDPTFTNFVITRYSKLSLHRQALDIFFSAHHKKSQIAFFSIPPVLKSCALLSAYGEGRQVHAFAVTRGFCSNVFIQTGMIDFYSKNDDLDSARKVFDWIAVKDSVSYNCLISGYSKSGNVFAARQLFEEMKERTVASWNSMISCYAHNGDTVEGLRLFERMQMERAMPNEITLVTVLSICAKLGDLELGLKIKRLIDNHNLRKNLIVRTAVLEMYVKCGAVDEARQEFDQMDCRDIVAWGAMIAGYAQNGRSNDALELFEKMRLENYKPNEVTAVSVLSACGQLGSVEAGARIGSYIESLGLTSSVYVGSALLDMYAKCGNIVRACLIFDEMQQRDVVSWNSMLSGLAFNGFASDAIVLYQKMMEAKVEPNDITFVGLFTACTHAGLVDLGLEFFDNMRQNYDIIPKVEHCACIVDLLCRSGRLEDAYRFICKMEVEPNVVIWGTLLSACRNHSNVELAERSIEKLLVLEPENSANYVLLANIYASAGRWEEALKMRDLMKDKRVQKTAGYSWIEVENMVHKFLVGDTSHPKLDEIYSVVVELSLLSKWAGHVSDVNL